jgi:hypothetical protein
MAAQRQIAAAINYRVENLPPVHNLSKFRMNGELCMYW